MSVVHDVAFRALGLLPPETAHRVATAALRAGLGPKRAGSVETGGPTLFGKPVANRVGLSAGADKTGLAIAAWRDVGFGFEEAGTVTRHPRAGNPGKRVWRLPDGRSMVNWMGLPNPGIEAFAENLAAFRRSPGGESHLVGASLSDLDGGPDAIAGMARRLDGLVDFVAVNLSCPNVKGHSDAWDSALRLVEEAAKSSAVPVVAKLAPAGDMEAFASSCVALRDAGAGGFAACNTAGWGSRDLLLHVPAGWPKAKGSFVGGYSGPLLFPVSLAMVRTVREALGNGPVVFGCGGIQTREAAEVMISNGADAIQVYTGVARRGPGLVTELVRAVG